MRSKTYTAPMTHNVSHDKAPQVWVDALEQARRDVAAGNTVSAPVVHAMLRKRLDKLRNEVIADRKAEPVRNL